ncbi:MAG: hypothetical protein LBT54_01370 [Bifidobacteriaceae bacterium]|jgi:hypothetical protein|nr:hypothetical protein [Bifidobacteriaceae bacterium]
MSLTRALLGPRSGDVLSGGIVNEWPKDWQRSVPVSASLGAVIALAGWLGWFAVFGGLAAFFEAGIGVNPRAHFLAELAQATQGDGVRIIGWFFLAAAACLSGLGIVTRVWPEAAVRNVTVGGRAATAIVRPAVTQVWGPALLTAFWAAVLAIGVRLALGGHGGAGTAMGVVALLGSCLSAPIPDILAGGWPAGGLWLTADGVAVRDGSAGASVGWDCLSGARARVDRAVVELVSASGEIALGRRWLGRWRGGRVRADRLSIGAAHLALGACRLEAVLAHYIANPSARAELGTPAALAAIERLARDTRLDPGVGPRARRRRGARGLRRAGRRDRKVRPGPPP